jgi:uncharacterized protein (DUF433 family)
MSMSRATDHPYIVSDPSGEPVIHETRVPVRAIVELWRVGVRPEEVPDHLAHVGLAQVFDALSYYADHLEEIDQFIDINRVEDHEVHPSIRGK